MESTQYLSQEKFDELTVELKQLKLNTIPEIAVRIDEAKQLGDLSENAEYHDARDQMAWTQSRVKEIEAILDNSEIVVDDGVRDGVVTIGSVVTVSVNKKEKEYTIVGAQEADPVAGRISNESPLGEAFLGRKKGDVITIDVPSGTQEYKIISVK
jgi:transcription elongation factor GreA